MLRRLRPILLPLLALVSGFLLHGCEGTSSGVDNPGLDQLTVSFRDAGGSPVRVSGELDVYYKDQNPALKPGPVVTVRIQNSSFTSLNGEDFRRIQAATKRAATARNEGPAGQKPAGPQVSAVDFNVVFRSEVRTGSLTFGLAYDPASSAFSRDGGGLQRLDLQPRPLVRFEARVQLDSVHGDLGRVYIPGTPFQATLAEGGFTFEGLPEGVFPLRLLGGDGSLFAVRESLDTKETRIFTASREAIGKVDTTDPDTLPARFIVYAGADLEGFVNVASLLTAKVTGIAIDTNDPRISAVWRHLSDGSPDSAFILSPTRLQTQVKFRKPGAYSFELSVTMLAHTERDTATILVREAPPPKDPAIYQPKPGDTLYAGATTKISWEMPMRGTVAIELRRGDGWLTLADSVPTAAALSFHAWTPADSLAPMHDALIRVRMLQQDSLKQDFPMAVMIKPFVIMANPLRVPKPPAMDLR